MIQKEEADEKVKQGWIRTAMIFEVIGVNEDVTKNALKELMEKLDRDKRVAMYKRDFSDVAKVENPTKTIKQGFSQVCEIDLAVKNLESLLEITMGYGPSGVEILEPKTLQVPLGEAQSIVSTLSQLIHRFAAAGPGGLLFVKEKVA